MEPLTQWRIVARNAAMRGALQPAGHRGITARRNFRHRCRACDAAVSSNRCAIPDSQFRDLAPRRLMRALLTRSKRTPANVPVPGECESPHHPRMLPIRPARAPKTASPSPAAFRYGRPVTHGMKPGSQAGMKGVSSRPDLRTEPAPARGPASAMIEIDHVSQIFRTSGRQAHLALSDISLTIEDGAFVSILGPSGCGKSTLLYIVGGFVSPTEGEARVKGGRSPGPVPIAARYSRNSRCFPGRPCSAM